MRIALDRLDQVGDQVGTPLILVQNLAPRRLDRLVLPRDGINIAGSKAEQRGGIPGMPDEGLGSLLRNTDKSVRKKELVILLKPTIIDSDRGWEHDVRETRRRMEALR